MMDTNRTQAEIEQEINHVIKTKIQPGVDQHGGVVKLENFAMDTGRATMLMSGSCSGCASSTATLKMGIERMLTHYVPEVKSVEGVDDPEFDNPYYRDIPPPPNMTYEEMLEELEQSKIKENNEDGDTNGK